LLLNQGTISSDPGGHWRVDMAEVEETRLPGSLGELFHARLEQLSPEEQRLLSIAAVMGAVFWDVALWQDSGANDALSPEAVDAALAKLKKERLIVTNQMWSFAGTQAYTFAHPLLRKAAYHDLKPSNRRTIHRQVADWLKNEQQNGRAGCRFPIDALIAHHLEQAGGDTRPTDQEPIAAVPFLANGRQ
jgi:predicted ATPase